MQSQHETSAFASMVISSLPFPPLPVLVLQGQDGEYGMASSYDLLQTAIMNARIGIRVPPARRRAGRPTHHSVARVDMVTFFEPRR